jgi:hypothetical protein
MSHMHYCEVGHQYQCSSSECICVCDIPYENSDHSECAIELRVCPNHKSDVTPADVEAVKEAEAISIQFPTAMPRKLNRLMGSKKYVAFCYWCGFGYEIYSRRLEAEHFAQNCPGAPAELRSKFRR